MINEDFQEQRDAYYEPLNQTSEPEENITVLMSQSFEDESTEDGEPGSRYDRVLLRVGDVTDAELDQYADDHWPVEHCMHSHDCCGHWYQMFRPAVERSGKLALVTVSYTCNI